MIGEVEGSLLPVARDGSGHLRALMNVAHEGVEGIANDLLRPLDERAAREGRSRSALIREAIKSYLYDEERERISREIVEGYERIPPTDEEESW